MLHYDKPAHHGFNLKRNQERFVDVELRREPFAYACEAYSRTVQIGDRRQRLAFAAVMSEKAHTFPVDMMAEIGELVLKAARARNGWKVIQEGTRIRPTKWRDQVKTASAAIPATPFRYDYPT